MRTVQWLSAVLLVVLALAGLPQAAAQGETQVYLPVVAKRPFRLILSGTDTVFKTVGIYVSELNGAPPLRIADLPGYTTKLSPRGDQIAFKAIVGDVAQVFLMRLDGTGIVQLTNIPGGVWEMLWSPDGSRLAVQGIWSYRLYVINADGTGLRPLTNAQVEMYDWSPDGTRMVYSALPDQIPWSSVIRVLNVDGPPSETDLFRASDQLLWLEWSPDGERIAFVLDGDDFVPDDRGVFIMNTEGTILQSMLTTARITGLDWSPNGADLAVTTGGALFLFDRDGNNRRTIFRVPYNPYNPQPVCPTTQAPQLSAVLVPAIGWPQWSPDGRMIVVFEGPWGGLCAIRMDGTIFDAAPTVDPWDFNWTR